MTTQKDDQVTSASQSQPRDTIPHILSCISYEDLKDEFFDPSNDIMITEFFRRVVKRRMETGDD